MKDGGTTCGSLVVVDLVEAKAAVVSKPEEKEKGSQMSKGGGKCKSKGKHKSSSGKGSKRDPSFVCGSYDH